MKYYVCYPVKSTLDLWTSVLCRFMDTYRFIKHAVHKFISAQDVNFSPFKCDLWHWKQPREIQILIVRLCVGIYSSSVGNNQSRGFPGDYTGQKRPVILATSPFEANNALVTVIVMS